MAQWLERWTRDLVGGGGGGMDLSSGPALDATCTVIDHSRNTITYYNALYLSLQNIVQTLSSVSPGR